MNYSDSRCNNYKYSGKIGDLVYAEMNYNHEHYFMAWPYLKENDTWTEEKLTFNDLDELQRFANEIGAKPVDGNLA